MGLDPSLDQFLAREVADRGNLLVQFVIDAQGRI